MPDFFNTFVPTLGVIGVKDVVIETFSEGEAEAVTLGECYVWAGGEIKLRRVTGQLK
ncbi:hypothetical protein [uncultured Varibaculum sp.]|uniref:hypothetical protein n=1 Tax=uncultured Varibaculum sp. TaxID=413896 RepID=UPI0028040EBB|nr:hypothetical protein [uncultured Varibaculum sp.]